MRTKRPLAALIFAGLIALAGCSADGEGTDPADAPETDGASEEGAPDAMTPPEADIEGLPDVIAEVNGEEIGKEQFVATYEGQLQQAFMMQQGGEIDQDELKARVADQLVNNLLLVQAAQESGIEASDEDVDKALEELGAQNGLETVEEVYEVFETQGISKDMVRADAASQVKIDAFLQNEMDVDEPSEEDLKEQYEELVEMLEAQGGGEGEETPSFDEVRELLADQATQEQKNEQVNQIIEGLLSDADVVIHL